MEMEKKEKRSAMAGNRKEENPAEETRADGGKMAGNPAEERTGGVAVGGEDAGGTLPCRPFALKQSGAGAPPPPVGVAVGGEDAAGTLQGGGRAERKVKRVGADVADRMGVMARIRALEPGEAAAFPLEKVLTLRVIVCNMNLAAGARLWRTESDRQEGVAYVERVRSEE